MCPGLNTGEIGRLAIRYDFPAVLLVEDRKLLDEFRRGSPEALDRVFREYAPAVALNLQRGFGISVGNRDRRFRGYDSTFEREDALHEVFVRAFSERARLSYDGLHPFRNYLFGITRAVVIDEYRARERMASRLVEEDAPQSDDAEEGRADPLDEDSGAAEATGNPGLDLEDAELKELVREFRSSLSPEEAEVFRLRFVEGASLEKVEAAIGRSPSRTKTLERKLREQFLASIWESGYLDGWMTRNKGGWIARLASKFESLVEAKRK